jgi:hypothetical protein
MGGHLLTRQVGRVDCGDVMLNVKSFGLPYVSLPARKEHPIIARLKSCLILLFLKRCFTVRSIV